MHAHEPALKARFIQKPSSPLGALRKEKPDDPDLVMFDGALAQRNHRSIKRSRSLRKQPSTHPSFPEAYYNWGSLLLSRRDYQQALDVLAKAAEDAPHSHTTATPSPLPSDIRGTSRGGSRLLKKRGGWIYSVPA